MATTTDVSKGMVILFNNEPCLIIEREFYKPGKGGAFNRTKLKGLVSGKVINQTFRSGEALEEAEVESRTAQFSYADAENAFFMDSETYEMVTISLKDIDGGTNYLIADAKFIIMYYEEKPISIQLPAKVELEVTLTADGGDRGNTSGNPTKEATLETGMEIKVPLFIKTGDRIYVSTEDGSYGGKVN